MYDPAAHGEHVDEPHEEEVPAGHNVQIFESSAELFQSVAELFQSTAAYPGLQMQTVLAVVGDPVFAGHVTHALDPVAFLNVPASHPVHVPPSKPV